MSVFHSSCEAEAVLSFYAKIPPEVQRERRSRDGGHSVKRWRVPRGRWCVQSGEGASQVHKRKGWVFLIHLSA